MTDPLRVRARRFVTRFAADAIFRNTLRLKLFGSGKVFQLDNVTHINRYPTVFEFLRHELADRDAVRILSFGCSTGEEVLTLRHYLPDAAIRGIDINRANIAECRRRTAGLANISIACAGSTEAEPADQFDAILCMAVLRDSRLNDRPAHCSRYIRFATFARAIADFHRCLKPGGLLAIRHTNFRVCDTPAARGFLPVLSIRTLPASPLYGPDDRLMPGCDYFDAIFRKSTDQPLSQ